MYKRALIILSVFLFSIPYIFAQSTERIDLTLRNSTLKEFCSAIEKQTDYTFMYTNIDLSKISSINLDKKSTTLKELLDEVLPGRNISYEIAGSQIILKQIDIRQPQLMITGTVTDSFNEPLIGVSVILSGTRSGTVTNIDGEYTIPVFDDRSQLEFSYVGYKNQLVTVGRQRSIKITLEENSEVLDEVVIIAYGAVKKTSLTAAVSTLKGAEVAKKPVTNLSNSMVGNIPGVIAQQSSGEPGIDGSSIRIRGSSTTGNGSPLLIVDGVPRSFGNLDPNTVESFTVLKDAAAVAPYGMGGANGVILVTTKKGKTGAPTLSYNGYVGIQNPTRMPKMVDSYQYTLFQNEAARNSGLLNLPFSDYEIEQYKKTVDGAADADPDRYPNSRGLRDVLQKNALITQHNIELSGGNDYVTYYTSLGYQHAQGQFATVWSNRYNASMSISIQATPTTRISASINGYVTNYNFPGKTDIWAGRGDEQYISANGGIMYQGYRTPPTSPIWYSNGKWGSYIGKSLVGYVYESGYAKKDQTQLYTTFSIEQQLPFLKGLSVKGLVSYDPNTYTDKTWRVPVLSYAADFSTDPVDFSEVYTEMSNPQLAENFSDTKAFTYQGHVNYTNSFGKHNVALLAVAEARETRYKNLFAERKNFPLYIDEIGMGSTAQGDVSNGGSSSKATQVGFVFRGSYNYAEKYFAEVSGRYDGSYHFAPGKRWGFFPSGSLAWNIAQESFMKENLPWVDMMKIRTSYGSSGILAGSAYQYLTGYNIYSNSAYFNGSATTGIYEKEPQANTEITWEKAKKFNVGTDLIFWNGLLSLSFDYFYEKRSDMLWTPQVLVPEEYGTAMPDINSAIMSNQGVEFEIGTTARLTKDLTLRVNGNFTFAKNKLLEIFETSSTYDNPNRRKTGRSNGTQFGYLALGYYTPEDFLPDGSLKEGITSIPDTPVQPGDLKYADMNGDGKIDSDDITVIGYPNGMPQIIFGLNTSLAYKGFDIGFLLQGAGRVSLPLGGSLVFPFDQQGSATELAFKDHWTPDNTDALYPRVYSNQPDYNTRPSSWWCRNASYLRLKNMEVGYTVPFKISRKMHMQNLRFYVSGQNLWTWTPKIKEKIDPEAQSANGQYYYQQQVFSFGLNVTF